MTKSRYRSFSSPDQFARIQMVIIENWQEVQLAVKVRNELGYEALMAESKLTSDQFIPPLIPVFFKTW
jgi:hypothetical protein